MKREIRVIGIDDAPFDKFKERRVLVVGIVYRGSSFMEGALSTDVSVDGNDATKKVAVMVNKSKFKPQLRCIMMKGIAVAGFNVIDIKKLHEMTKLPVIVVMRSYPNIKKIKSTLTRLKMKSKIKKIKNAGEIHKIGRLYVQSYGTTKKNAEEFLKTTTSRAFIPEPLRIAHIVAGGIKRGESRGHA